MNIFIKNTYSVVIGLALIALLVVSLSVIYPTVMEIVNVNQRISDERQSLEEKLAQGLNLKKIKESIKQVESNIDGINGALIEPGQELEFVRALETIARNNQIKMEINSDFIGSKMSKEVQQIPIKLNLTGNYQQIVQFLQDIESLPYYYNIDSLVANSRTTASGINIISQVTGNTYLKIKTSQ